MICVSKWRIRNPEKVREAYKRARQKIQERKKLKRLANKRCVGCGSALPIEWRKFCIDCKKSRARLASQRCKLKKRSMSPPSAAKSMTEMTT
jgi:hypothetical protein